MSLPLNSFQEFKLNKQLLNAVVEAGYNTPTLIQQKTIPAILSGQHVMGIAQTGTGKTAAYLLPVLKNLSHAQGHEPRALIILPTRELALQIADNIKAFSKYTDLRYSVIYGGTGTKLQKQQIENGIDLLVATPGRLLEFYSNGILNLKKIKIFVLDEADKLMDMGFIRQIHSILEIIPRKRQNLLFSATMSDLVKKIAGDFMEFPTIINIEPEKKTASTVSQEVYFIPNFNSKLNLLKHLLLNEKSFSKVIVFCKTKKIATALYECLKDFINEESLRLIHGNKEQQTRINAMNAFKNEDVRLLITTDVAARGLDITDVSHVINFDVPLIYEDYIHPIGRTGRAFKAGASITFCNSVDEYHLEKIQKLIQQRIPVKEVPADVFIEKTDYEEKQQMDRELDHQKRKEDPEFKGAFHEKKNAAFHASKTKRNKKGIRNS